MIAVACLLALTVTVSKCGHELIKKQDTPSDCGDTADPSTDIGRCTEANENEDTDPFCNGDCISVFREYYECIGVSYDYQELEQFCDGAIALISTLTAVFVAVHGYIATN